MNRYILRRFFPNRLFLIERCSAESIEEIVRNIMTNDKEPTCYAVTVTPDSKSTPKTHHGEILKRAPVYYFGEEILSLRQASQIKECESTLKRFDHTTHKALVKCRKCDPDQKEIYMPLSAEDYVFNSDGNQIWPQKNISSQIILLANQPKTK